MSFSSRSPAAVTVTSSKGRRIKKHCSLTLEGGGQANSDQKDFLGHFLEIASAQEKIVKDIDVDSQQLDADPDPDPDP